MQEVERRAIFTVLLQQYFQATPQALVLFQAQQLPQDTMFRLMHQYAIFHGFFMVFHSFCIYMFSFFIVVWLNLFA